MALVWRDGIGFVLQVTVMHSMQAGYLEKAQKYTDKALMQLEKLKSTIFCPLIFLSQHLLI